MSLTHIEEMLVSKKLPFHKDKEGLVIAAHSNDTQIRYPILISQQKGGLVQAMVWLPPCKAARIERVDELCTLMTQNLDGRIKLAFSAIRHSFYAGSYLDVEQFDEDMERLVGACDFMFPLCVQVNQTGRWDRHLLALLFFDIDELYHA